MDLDCPNTSRTLEETEGELSWLCGFAKRLVRYWMNAHLDRGFNGSDLPRPVLRIAFAMHVKAVRQFRAAIDLCQRGDAASASIMARSMFETALVVGFVLKPRFMPRTFDKEGRPTRLTIKTRDAKGRSIRRTLKPIQLSREFRAMLYIAHRDLQPNRDIARYRKRPGMLRYVRRLDRFVTQHGATIDWEATLGPDWVSILEASHTYSGLNLHNLAASLGKPFPAWYHCVYGKQSRHVHADDVYEYLQFETDGTAYACWQDPIGKVEGALLTATAMFYAMCGMLNQHVKFGVAVNTALDGFHKEYMGRLRG